MASSRQDATKLADSDLVERTRTGDTESYAELWRRHARAGITVARSHTSSLEADDLVAESFAKIFQAIQSGGGPTGAFRPYLFTTIRNTAAAWGRARHETAIDDADDIADPDFTDESAIAALDRSLTAHAFRSLPTRWQEALWYSEVEQMAPTEIAPLLGMKPNAVAALTYRAREGLRQAWIQAHLKSVPEDSDCRWTIDRLGAYARAGLGKRDTARIEEHLAGCAKCTIVASEAKDVGSRLALVLLPLVAGAVGATGYTAWLQSGTHATAYALGASGAVMPASAVASPGSGGSSSSGSAASTGAASTTGTAAGVSAGVITGLVAAGVLVVAGVVAALTLGPLLFSPAPKSTQADSGTTQAAPRDPSGTRQGPDPAVSAPPTTSTATRGSVDRAASSGSRADVDATTPGAEAPAAETPAAGAPATPSQPSALDAPGLEQQTVDPAGVLTATGTAAPGNRVDAVLTPVASTAARGFARTAVRLAIPVGSATAGADGRWTITADIAHFANGDYRLAVTQTDAHGRSSGSVMKTVTLNIAVAAPVVTSVQATALPVVVSGTAAGADTVEIALGELQQGARVTDGSWTVSLPADSFPNGHYPLTVVASYRGHASTALEQDVPLAVPPTLDSDVDWTINDPAQTLRLGGEGSPGDELTVTAGTTTATTTVGADRTWTLDVAIPAGPNGDLPVTITQANSDPALSTSVSPAPTLQLRRPLAAPTVTIDTGADNRYYPVFSGTAAPGSTVTISIGTLSVTAGADSVGNWSTSQIDAEGDVTVVQDDRLVPTSPAWTGTVQLAAPPVVTPTVNGWSFTVSVAGLPSARVETLSDRAPWLTITLDALGAYTDARSWTYNESPAGHTLGARYADGNGRYGSTSLTQFPAAEAPAAN
jgi:RNA polymerase sigma factor (sigma-70 family)